MNHSPQGLNISARKEETLNGSGLLQKQQVVSPFQILSDKLSFMRMTYFLKNHIKIYIFRHIFRRDGMQNKPYDAINQQPTLPEINNR